jgi:hypothetical protein
MSDVCAVRSIRGLVRKSSVPSGPDAIFRRRRCGITMQPLGNRPSSKFEARPHDAGSPSNQGKGERLVSKSYTSPFPRSIVFAASTL